MVSVQGQYDAKIRELQMLWTEKRVRGDGNKDFGACKGQKEKK